MIICLRAKYKTRQKKENGKTVIIKDEYTSPIQAEDFIFEATCHAEILPKHNINLTKTGHPALAKCFPGIDDGPLTIEHGRLIAEWCANAGGSTPKPVVKQPEGVQSVATLKTKLFTLTMSKHRGDKAAFKQWLIDEALIADDCDPSTLDAGQLSAVISKAEKRLK